jgi:gas vesicle protein
MAGNKGFGFGIGTFVIGAGLGVLAGLLYAPRAGVETRAMISEKVDEYWGQGQELYARGVERVQDTYNVAAGKVDEVRDGARPYIEDRNDELRSKINAARDRIAKEVSKNAESVHDTLADKIPAAASKVDELSDSAEATLQKAAEKIAPDAGEPADAEEN